MNRIPFFSHITILDQKRIGTDSLITLALLSLATAVSFPFFYHTLENSVTIALFYILALVLIARYTSGYLYGILASLFSVICVNYFFTYPFFVLNFTLTGYPLTFIVMLGISAIMSATTTHIKQQAEILAEREKLLSEVEKEKMRVNLLRAISHDLRTPLTSIIGSSSSYLEHKQLIDEKQKTELIQHIYEDSNWLLNMVENLLTITRINNETAQVTTSLEPVEEVVSEAVIRLKKRLPDAVIHVKVPDEFLMIPMDAILIEQVIMNLLENALIHSNSSLPVECTVRTLEHTVCFSITDYGTGILQKRLETIFDGNPNQSDLPDSQKGMGIGLSICKTIVTAHNGSIHAVNNNTCSGVTFYFELPKEERI